MKRLVLLVLTLTSITISSGAQTAKEIISRMEMEFEKHESTGVAMTIDTKIPILGTSSAYTYSLGEKSRMETRIMGVDFISWDDSTTTWTYTPETNEIEITNRDSESEDDGNDTDMFTDISDGYDIAIKKETPDAWHIKCSKSKSNKDEEMPKTIELVIAKGTYLPISMTAKMYGISVTMRDISFNVSEKDVTFNAADYPGAKIVDKR